jgi:two-component system LytT family response regulator
VTSSRPIRAFLIDDEPLALKRLARMLESTGRVEIVGRASDPERGWKQVAAADADVLFLDIHMPGLSGFEVVERLPAGPLVVFTTAYDQHAVQAFETNAIDYLLKPIEPARLDRTLDRVATRRDTPGDGEIRVALERLARHLRGPEFVEHLASRVGDRVQLIAVGQVTHVVARDRTTFAVTATGEHILDVTIAELERKLDPAKFFRIHRGTLVNVSWLGELHADIGGRLLLRLRDERRTELVVARDRVRPLKQRLGLL